MSQNKNESPKKGNNSCSQKTHVSCEIGNGCAWDKKNHKCIVVGTNPMPPSSKNGSCSSWTTANDCNNIDGCTWDTTGKCIALPPLPPEQNDSCSDWDLEESCTNVMGCFWDETSQQCKVVGTLPPPPQSCGEIEDKGTCSSYAGLGGCQWIMDRNGNGKCITKGTHHKQ